MTKIEAHYDRPLFRWKLLEDGSVLKTGPIYNYRVCPIWNDRYEFVMPGKSSRYYCKMSDLDEFHNNRVYSFDPDDLHADQIIMRELGFKRNDARIQLKKAQDILDKFTENFYKRRLEK